MRIQHLFFEPLAIEHSWESKVFFWSDLHLRHNRDFIYEPRKFKTVQESDETLLRRWRENITDRDIVFLLGDTVFGANGEEYLNGLFQKLPFKELFIMPGNHFAGYKQLFNHTVMQHIDPSLPIHPNKVVNFIPNYFEIFVNGQAIVMSHYAIVSWNGCSKGSWLLHGHNHNNLTLDLGKAIDLGVENCPDPQSFEDITKRMNEKKNITFDHHGPNDRNPFC